MIIDGIKIAEEIQSEIKSQVAKLAGRSRPPCLGVILIGDHGPSHIYVDRKAKACEAVGMRSLVRLLSTHITESELLAEVAALNDNPAVDGILVQLPLPPSINPNRIMHSISPDKDVDGFHPLNIGKMLIGETDGFFPCTPLGIKVLIERSGIEIAGKQALILGRSNIVGKPLAALLMQNTPGGNATVTIAHSRSQNLAAICRMSDIIIVAIGQPQFLKADMVREGTVVVDVGINKIPDASRKSGYRIVGDVDFDAVAKKCSFITPVPGGVGPMTIAMLLSNTLKSYLRRAP